MVGQAARLFLGLLAPGDLEPGADGAPRLSDEVEQRSGVADDRARPSPIPHHVHFHVHDRAAGAGRPLHRHVGRGERPALVHELHAAELVAGLGEGGVRAGRQPELASQVAVGGHEAALGIAGDADPDRQHVEQRLEVGELLPQPLVAPLELLRQSRVPNGDRSVRGQGLAELDVAGGEEAGLCLLDGVEPDHPLGREQSHAHPATDVLGPGVARPAGVLPRVRDQDAAAVADEGGEDGIRHVERVVAGEGGIAPALVAADRAHGQPPIVIEQHDAGGVVGDELRQVLEQLVEDGRQVERAGEIEGGCAQDVRGGVHRRGKPTARPPGGSTPGALRNGDGVSSVTGAPGRAGTPVSE